MFVLPRCLCFLTRCLFVFPHAVFLFDFFSLSSSRVVFVFSLVVYVFSIVVFVFPVAQLPNFQVQECFGARLGPCLLTASTTVSLSIELYAFEMSPCMRILLSLSFTGLLIAPIIASAPSLRPEHHLSCLQWCSHVVSRLVHSNRYSIDEPQFGLVVPSVFLFSYQWHNVSSQPEHR